MKWNPTCSICDNYAIKAIYFNDDGRLAAWICASEKCVSAVFETIKPRTGMFGDILMRDEHGEDILFAIPGDHSLPRASLKEFHINQ